MLKLIGSVCVIVGFAMLGAQKVSGLSAHAALLRQLQEALSSIRSEILFSLTPVPVLLERLGARQDAVGQLFQSCAGRMKELGDRAFADLWEECVELELGQALKQEEFRVVAGLGAVLGRYDAQEQAGAMDHALDRLEQFSLRAEEERSRSGRVYGTVSVLCGVAAVIILI